MDQIPSQFQINQKLSQSISESEEKIIKLQMTVVEHRLIIDSLLTTLQILNNSTKKVHLDTKKAVETHRILAVLAVIIIAMITMYALLG